ncbi:MAG: carboxypeptidase regulatory-like domain-containing protein, partial [Planctomycetia bacterium]|nr:carboxypeptidase regulatory-like domain-containing protein [Planctomycetia bacterium]
MSVRDTVDASRRRAVLVAAILLAAVGIVVVARKRPATTTIAGTVTADGRPVVFGTVTVLATDGRAYSAVIGVDGGYTLSNLPIGPVRIAVSSPDPRPIVVRAVEERLASAETAAPAAPTGGARAADAAAGPPPGGHAIAAPGEDPPAATPPVVAREGWFPIRGRYANPATSGLKADVELGANRVDLRV